MNSKILLLSIAVVAVGLFAMPSTLSLFAGQHTFDKAGNTTICLKCHSDVGDELQQSNYHTTLATGLTGSTCKGCHTADRVRADTIPKGNQTGNWTSSANTWVGLDIAGGSFILANASGNTSTYNFNGGVHAAVTVECVWCHGAVNLTNDAHSVYASNSTTGVNMRGSNAACIGCHTKTLVNMTWVRRAYYNTTFYFDNKSLTISPGGNSTTNTRNQ